MTNSIIRFFIDNKLIAFLLFLALTLWGIALAPFNWDIGLLPRDPVPVDAIPDIGENQQIVFTEWPGRSPQDVEDQITFPLTTQLQGLPGVRAVRSNSMFGFSSIYVIFEDDIEFYWSRTRILEKLNSLPSGTLPENVQPTLGPDATALGQIFWYTLEGRDSNGQPAGGWNPDELRSIQDFQIRYSLNAVQGVSEVASIGGFVREYQVDINPAAMYMYDISVADIADAVRKSNRDTGARTIEMNRAEYIVRGLGYITSLQDLEESVITSRENTPILLKDVATVQLGPAQRRGMLDKSGAEAVGGVITARYGENPLQVIENVKEEIEAISPGLPSKELEDGTLSKLAIVPFYDRSGLIQETLGTLEEALALQILITIIVVIVMILHLRSAFMISALLPVAVLMAFIMMKYTGVDANVVALAGIAISIGVVVDMGIILVENIVRRLDEASPDESRKDVIFDAVAEVSPAVVTALTTTIVSFLPVFLLQQAEGKLFGPLAFTKTYVLAATLVIVITMLPPLAHWLFARKGTTDSLRVFWNALMAVAGIIFLFVMPWAGIVLLLLAANNFYFLFKHTPDFRRRDLINTGIVVLAISWLLAGFWLPIGPEYSVFLNMIFVLVVIAALLGFFRFVISVYPTILEKFLQNKGLFLAVPGIVFILGLNSWLGFDKVFSPVNKPLEWVGLDLRQTSFWQRSADAFPGLGREFMPTLGEGSFLLMPTTMPHAGMEEVIDQIQKMDMRIQSIPEVDMVVGKVGRAESALDPAPTSMFENVINYKSEFMLDESGRRIRFRVNRDGEFERDEHGSLIPDRSGRFFRQWRDDIRSPDDIWNEIVAAADLPGVTSAPKLQPIETRIVMLQTGMRANIGMKITGPDLQTIDEFSIQTENILRDIDGIRPASVFADRAVGKPYLEIDLNRGSMARFGLTVDDVQQTITTAIGGEVLTSTVEGRERYPVRVRYAKEFRDSPEAMERILVPAPEGYQIPLGDVAEIRFATGPMNIRSENTFLVNYVTFDNTADITAVEAVERVQQRLGEMMSEGSLTLPAGINYTFEGEYQNQIRASDRFRVIIPVTLILLFLLIWFQFRSTIVTGIIFTGIAVAWAGGFFMLWLYGQPGFLDFSLFGIHLAELFQVQQIELSVAVWVGFLALFGIAVDDGVVMATYLKQSFGNIKTDSVSGVRKATIDAGMRRVRPCLMTTATTILALLPLLTSTGKGSEIMLPMAVPIFGGMAFQMITIFIVPVLFSAWMEARLNKENREVSL